MLYVCKSRTQIISMITIPDVENMSIFFHNLICLYLDSPLTPYLAGWP